MDLEVMTMNETGNGNIVGGGSPADVVGFGSSEGGGRGGGGGGEAAQGGVMVGTGNDVIQLIENLIYTKIILVVCLFGLVGNILNLVVLSQKSLTYTMERMEKSAHYGLIGLAVSDALVCVTVLPNSYLGPSGFHYYSLDFALIYHTYSAGVINTFILSSTWMTVVMASSRFVAICYPLKARQFIGKTFALSSIVVVIIICSLFNVPRFLRFEIKTMVYSGGGIISPLTPSNSSPFLLLEIANASYPLLPPPSPPPTPPPALIYFPNPGPMRLSDDLEDVYQWMYFVLGILFPLLVLVVCNVQLVLSLRRSERMRLESYAARHNSHVANRITLTLVVIVIMYVVLFVPGELLMFFKPSAHTTKLYNLALAVCNLCQTINFAVNFVLYCAINTHFRHTIWRLLHCSRYRRRSSEAGRSLSEVGRGPGGLLEGSRRSKASYGAGHNKTIVSDFELRSSFKAHSSVTTFV